MVAGGMQQPTPGGDGLIPRVYRPGTSMLVPYRARGVGRCAEGEKRTYHPAPPGTPCHPPRVACEVHTVAETPMCCVRAPHSAQLHPRSGLSEYGVSVMTVTAPLASDRSSEWCTIFDSFVSMLCEDGLRAGYSPVYSPVTSATSPSTSTSWTRPEEGRGAFL